MKDCIFCKIASGEIQAKKVYEDSDVVAFLDADPVNVGHMLVIPKKHFTKISDMSSNDLGKLMPAINKLSKAILKLADGLNVMQNNNKVAGQAIMHVHFHLIPRYEGDGYVFNWKHATGVTEKENEAFLKKIQTFLK